VIWGRGSGATLEVVGLGFGWKTGGLIWYSYPVHISITNTFINKFQLGELHARSETSIIPTWNRVRPTHPPNFLLLTKQPRIYIIPNADDLPTWTSTTQHIAKEGRCFVISVNQFCKVSDFPADYPPFAKDSTDRKANGSIWEKDDIVNRGGSCIIGPLGTFLVAPVRYKEVILYATLERNELIEARVISIVNFNEGVILTSKRWISIPWVVIRDRISCKSSYAVVDSRLTKDQFLDGKQKIRRECSL
jgi:hypothetical protein